MRERELEPNQHVPSVEVASRPLLLTEVVTHAPMSGPRWLWVELQKLEAPVKEAAYEHPLPGRATRPSAWVASDAAV